MSSGIIYGAAFALSLAACAREPIGAICPEVAKGELVITEIRGAQTGGDTYGQWVEIYNATAAPLDLEGLHVVFTRVDGGATSRAIIRRPLPIDAGGYVVIGRDDDAMLPPRVDYGMGTDFASSWYTGGTIELDACDQMIDTVQYTSLPTTGSWALQGAPDPIANDSTSSWCNDTEPNPDTTQLGLPGSPGSANPPC